MSKQIVPSPQTLEKIAMHEAGHCVMALLAGFPIQHTSLRAESTLITFPLSHPEQLVTHYRTRPNGLPALMQRVLMVVMAGAVAEQFVMTGEDLRLVRSWKKPWNDLLVARATGELDGPELLLFGELRQQALAATRDLFETARVRRQVDTLAQALLRCEFLDRDDVYSILLDA